MKKNDWKSEDIWVNYCFLPDNVVSLPNRNLRSKTLNGPSTTMNGDFNRAKKEVFPKKATTFLRNTSFYTQMRCLSIPLYKAPESSSDPQPSEHFYPNEPYHHLPYAR